MGYLCKIKVISMIVFISQPGDEVEFYVVQKRGGKLSAIDVRRIRYELWRYSRHVGVPEQKMAYILLC
jgi:hypothetical protein